MSKTKTIFVCQECGNQLPRWAGKCPACESWNSYVEERAQQPNPGASTRVLMAQAISSDVVPMEQVSASSEKRLVSGLLEFDRVMGGGTVPGSVTLIGGDPGIGKSTLVMQVGCALAQSGLKVLYVSGEESLQQAKIRAERINPQTKGNFLMLGAIDVQEISDQILRQKPDVVIVDSIQVVFLSEITSTAGSVAQVRESAAVLTQLAKQHGFALFLIGHVTKEGMIAGPRVLEHMVDTVLYVEGERYSTYRILRANKNRFGSTNELGIFEMTSSGLVEVANPSEIFLAQRPQQTSGSVVVPIIEGTRPFLVEVQALVSRSAFGLPRQKGQGVDANRLAILCAVLEKRLGLNLADKDIFVNVVGGMRVIDPAADLAIALSIASAFLDKPLGHDVVAIGEVGLSGEVRSGAQVLNRIHEAEKLGFSRCLLPFYNMQKLSVKPKSLQLIPVKTVREALDKIPSGD